MLVGIVAAIVLGGGGRAKAEIIMSEPTNVGPVINDASDVQECDFSHDGLELYFSAHRPGEYGKRDIYVARRETINDPWQEPVNLGPNVNSSGSEVEPSISGNGLELYFGCWDDWNLRVCTRLSKDAPWSSPVKVGPPVGSYEDNPPVGSNDAWNPDISADGLSLYFASSRVGGHGSEDIWVATRPTIDDPWTEPMNLGPNVNSPGGDLAPSISTDGLTLVFNRAEPWSLWATTRKSIDDDWGPAVDLGINNPGPFYGPAISPDGSTMYFDGAGSWGGYGDGDIWQVKFIPIVDFNSDEIVAATDICILVDNWHTENTHCDIAPLPLGDGYVDVQDLIILAEHLFEEVNDPTLVAHWALDETEGEIAFDSANDNDGTVYGDPAWKPEGGMVDGALQLDGIDDYVNTPFVLNPADGRKFSIYAWIQGGAPGQVVISQEGGANWLCTDSLEGNLMTELKGTGRGAAILQSQTIITNDNWHRIGFVWDGAYRSLYVDDILVAEDIQQGLISSVGGLNIGCGSNASAGTFWAGLIDDIRIYNRVVRP